MAVFNTPFELVKRAIDSVLRQDFQDFELIVLDDGSNEALGLRLLQYCQMHQAKLTYVRHQNCGQSQSINRGVKMSNGTYIAIIDSDDRKKLLNYRIIGGNVQIMKMLMDGLADIHCTHTVCPAFATRRTHQHPVQTVRVRTLRLLVSA